MEIDNQLLPLIIALGCLSGVLMVVLICLLIYFCYVVYRDREIARREAAYIEEEPEGEARDDDIDTDDPLYEHICTVVDTNRDKDGGEDDGQIHSNGHVTVDIENGVDGGVGISFDPAFEANGHRNSRVIISDNGVYSSIDREDVGTEAAETEARRPGTTPSPPAAVEAKASVYEDIDSVRRHPSRNNSTDREDDVSTDGSESCTNEQGEPIYSKPDMSKKLNRQSTAPETDASVSLSQSTDSAIAECDDTPPSLPKKSDDLME